MTDAYGNVNVGPGFWTTAYTTNTELLAATGSGYNQDGVTLRVGQGVLATGQPLVLHEDGTYGPVNADDRTVAATFTTTASGNLITTPAAHGLAVGNEVQLGTIATTTGISAATTYYVLTVPTAEEITVSATNGGSVVTLTNNGTGTNLIQLEDAAEIVGFLRDQVDTEASPWSARQGNRVYRGVLNYAVIVAANGNTPLTSAQLTALGARVDTVHNYLIF